MRSLAQGSLRTIGIPLCTLVLLIAIYALGDISQGPRPGAQAYFQKVASEIDALPYRIGDWFGVNIPYTEVEVQMLHPNKLLQRTYQDHTTGQRASLSIVHCTDMRDMIGHYPPNCYPAHGWDFDSNEVIDLTIDGRAQEARVYQFSRRNQGIREVIRIVSFFVVPYSGGIQKDMKALEAAVKNPQAAGLGAAQVQILTPASQRVEATNLIVSKIIETVEPVVDTIEEGVK